METRDLPVIVGITGASGVCYGIRVLELLRDMQVPAHLVVSKAGVRTLTDEMDMKLADVAVLAEKVYPVRDIGAAIASGSFKARGMVIAPTTVRTMSEIASGVTSSLVTRAADVTLKERRPLILMVRETPLHTGHLRTMTKLSEMGAVIAPAMPAFYTRPQSLGEVVTQSAGRMLDLLGLDSALVKRWTGSAK